MAQMARLPDRKATGLATGGAGIDLTAATRYTGYTSRQSQARPSGRTGTSGVSRSRETDADLPPRTHENPRPEGSETKLHGYAVTTDLGASESPMSDRPMADATRLNARPPQGGRVSPSLLPLPPAGVA